MLHTGSTIAHTVDFECKTLYIRVGDSHTKPLYDVKVSLAHSDQAESIRENVLTQNQNLLWVCCPLVVDPNSTILDHLIPSQENKLVNYIKQKGINAISK